MEHQFITEVSVYLYKFYSAPEQHSFSILTFILRLICDQTGVCENLTDFYESLQSTVAL